MDLEIDFYTKIFKEVSSVPVPTGAKIFTNQKDNLCIHTTWSSKDLVKSEQSVFAKDYTVERETLSVLCDGIVSDQSYITLQAITRNGKRQAVLREKSPGDKMFLEFWNGLTKEATFDMTECKEHGKIHTNSYCSRFQFSANEKFLLYIAEEKQPMAVSFFKTPAGSKEENENTRGQEYAYKEDWGETCVGIHHPVLCIFEIETGNIEVLPTSEIDKNISIIDAVWGPNDESIVYVGCNELPYRLGLSGCSNRRSAIYSIDLKTKRSERLTESDNVGVRSPRFSPKFDVLVYLEYPSDGTYTKGAKLMKYDLNTKHTSLAIGPVDNPLENEFPGLYLYTPIPISSWSENGQLLYVSSIWRSREVILCVNLESGHVKRVEIGDEFGAATVLDVFNNIIVAHTSALNVQPCLLIGRINENNGSVIDWKFLDEDAPVKDADIHWEIQRMLPEVQNNSFPDLDYEIIIAQPAGSTKKRPIIVTPHGGPHDFYFPSFMPDFVGFIKLGYIVCLVNYRGSLGFGDNNLTSLLGKIGSQDVADVQQASVYMKNKFSVDDIFLHGISHGGFLTAHLSGQFPDFYKAAVLLNPATDLCRMCAGTDIPDWAMVESGFSFDPSSNMTPEQFLALWEKSPMKYAENVRIPSLLFLGKKDLRVPYSQGLNYYRLLKARNVPVELYHYEDNHPLRMAAPNGDHFVRSAIWFKKYSSS